MGSAAAPAPSPSFRSCPSTADPRGARRGRTSRSAFRCRPRSRDLRSWNADRRRVIRALLGADSGDAGVRETRIEPLEKRGGWIVLRFDGPHDHDAVDRTLGRPDRSPRRSGSATRSTAACPSPRRIPVPTRARDSSAGRHPGTRRATDAWPDAARASRVDRNADAPDAERLACARVGQGPRHRRAANVLGRADEQHGDLLSLQPVRHDVLVRAFDEGMIGGRAAS